MIRFGKRGTGLLLDETRRSAPLRLSDVPDSQAAHLQSLNGFQLVLERNEWGVELLGRPYREKGTDRYKLLTEVSPSPSRAD